MAISRAFARLFATRCDTRLVLASLAAAIACCMVFSSSETVLDQAQRQALQGEALRVDGWDDVVGHGFRGFSWRMRRYYYRRRRRQAIVKLPGILQHNA